MGLVAQSLAALGATGRQDLAAVAGGHALAETVLLLSVDLLGLIGTLHVRDFLSFYYSAAAGCRRSWKNYYATCVLYTILRVVSTKKDNILGLNSPFFLLSMKKRGGSPPLSLTGYPRHGNISPKACKSA